MALFNIEYGSETMNKYMGLKVILPAEDLGMMADGKFPVLYLLHGYTADYTKWLRMTSVERYANETGIAVVMPDAGKSFYTDMVHGDPYFTYLTEEVPAYVQKWLPVTSDPEYTYIAGLSMGGYGAMKMALTYPERYKAAATFSGALAVPHMLLNKFSEDEEPWMQRLNKDLPLIYGYDTDITGTKDDVFALATMAKEEGNALPELYVSCGTDDFVYPATESFRDLLTSLAIPFVYEERPGFHEWGFWDEEVRRFMTMIA